MAEVIASADGVLVKRLAGCVTAACFSRELRVTRRRLLNHHDAPSGV